ncbi:hypothetical protein KY290_003592 [Solanum tuberosum]|uniref:Uncharacterized protein n=1 Tax=Solanum tuberosum TaxID=4113 RepID=A0ABQ7WTD6_SOLTU|nr:hypothetical protein KY290_003592 [Solanum tuberosum]
MDPHPSSTDRGLVYGTWKASIPRRCGNQENIQGNLIDYKINQWISNGYKHNWPQYDFNKDISNHQGEKLEIHVTQRKAEDCERKLKIHGKLKIAKRKVKIGLCLTLGKKDF